MLRYRRPVDAALPARASAPARRAAPILLTLFLLAAALSAFTLLRPVSPHDEGLMLQAGLRIAHGQLPYRDFWTNYPPGQALLLAGLDKLFGVSLLSWRIVRVIVDAATALLAYRLVVRSGASRRWAWLDGWAWPRRWRGRPARPQPAGARCWPSPRWRWRPAARWWPARSPGWRSSSGWRSGWRRCWGC